MRAPVSTLILGNRSPIWVIGSLRPVHIWVIATQIWTFTDEIVSAADEIVSVTDRKGKIMSEIQEIAQHIQDFPAIVRKSRMDKGITNEELAELSGVSYSAVCKVQSGERDPKLYDAVAIMKSVGLSVDQVFDIQQPDTTPSAMQERIHKLELGNAVSAGDVERLTQVNDLYQTQLSDLREQNKSYRHWAVFSTIFSVVLSVFLIAYLWFDFRVPNDGFIRHGDFTLVAWVIVLLLVISFCYVGITAYKIVKNSPAPTKAK